VHMQGKRLGVSGGGGKCRYQKEEEHTYGLREKNKRRDSEQCIKVWVDEGGGAGPKGRQKGGYERQPSPGKTHTGSEKGRKNEETVQGSEKKPRRRLRVPVQPSRTRGVGANLRCAQMTRQGCRKLGSSN